MKQNIKNNENGSVTQIALISIAGLAVITLAINLISPKTTISAAVLGEESEMSTESDDGELSFEGNEESTEEYSTDGEYEVSTQSEVSTQTSIDNLEQSDVSIEEETSEETSVETSGETSEASVESELSVSDFDVIKDLDQNMAIVSNNKKLFFLIPVEIEKILELDESGAVIGVKQTFFSKLLEWLSF